MTKKTFCCSRSFGSKPRIVWWSLVWYYVSCPRCINVGPTVALLSYKQHDLLHTPDNGKGTSKWWAKTHDGNNIVGSTPPYKLLLYAPIDSLAEPTMIILKNIPLISYKFSIMLTCKKWGMHRIASYENIWPSIAPKLCGRWWMLLCHSFPSPCDNNNTDTRYDKDV